MCDWGDPGDGDAWKVWTEHPVKARKEHRCDGCYASIAPGDIYLRHFSVVGQSPTQERACAACWAAREQFHGAHGWWYAPSYLIQSLRDCIGENDDEEDEWRPVLAAVLKRYRVSPTLRAIRRKKTEARHAQ